jgi:GDPmannose 4,6-dehydratase
MAKIAIITGVTGQDGSYLAEYLLEQNYTVYGIIRRTSSPNLSRLGPELLIQIEIIESDSCDVMSNNAILSRVGSDAKVIEIYNLAAQSHVHTSFEQPSWTFQVNTMSVLGWLEAIRQSPMRDKIKFYQASTSEMFGKVQEIPQSETTPFYPKSPYGVSKLSAHWICKNYRESYGLKVYCGILFNHESERRGENFVTRKITKGLCNPPVILGNLDAKRDWGHAKDYVRAMWMMMQYPDPRDFVISSGETHTIREFVEEACKVRGIPVRWEGDNGYDARSGQLMVTTSPEFMRPSEVDLLIGDSSDANRLLSWYPRITFKELVRGMVEFDAGIRFEQSVSARFGGC